MIKSWMVNLISKEIVDLFVFCTSSKSLWDILAERYGVSNAPQMYHLQRHTSSITQGSDSVTTYFNKINRSWDEMGRLNPLPACTCGKCTCNVSKKIADLDNMLKLMQFLLGLTPSYDVIRTQILNLSPSPSINKAYAMAVSDESQRQINLSYTIHGYPEWFKEMKEKRASEQKKHAVNLVNDKTGDTPISQGYGNTLTNPNTINYANLWIIDTGATSHMCSNESLMKDMKPLSHPRLVHLPNKSKKVIHSTGTITINSGLRLKDVLFIPFVKYNLLSVNKLAKDDNTSFVFYSESCILQDQKSKKILAKGTAVGNLYYLNNESRCTSYKACNFSDESRYRKNLVHETNMNAIREMTAKCDTSTDSELNKAAGNLWHFRLGHASENVLEHIDQICFFGLENNLCVTYHSAKQTRMPFRNSDTRAEHKMELLHIDLWGPYKF
ncbi:Retrovirus-related Pol polyprotein from transposon TNT 1-94 [Senna tora]|uniref:Retrovirus-related Pol polyprotein from transposon TNT 1-94 n=1 Tax=Senna tora TaxID=362788 RepID=A0A834TSB7_9FABA|nr:Retrovirus-related Pol polyprotein from transposon TNT 1-94 [Senna tora]